MSVTRAARYCAFALMATLAACSEDAIAPDPSVIEVVAGNSQTGPVGTALATELSIRVLDSKGFPVRGRPVTWTVGTGSGTIQPIDTETDRTGQARARWIIGNTTGPQTATAAVEGLPPVSFSASGTPGPAAVIALGRDSVVTRNVGETVQVSPRVTDQYGNQLVDQTVTWTSSNESVATVSSTGLVTTRGRGMASITARRGNAVSILGVRVVEIARIVVTPSPVTFTALNQTQQLTARVEDAQGVAFTNVAVQWSPVNPGIVSVNSAGVARAEGQGSTIIVARADNAQTLFNANVNQVITSVSIGPATPSVAVGNTLQLTATARDAGGSAVPNQTFTWTIGGVGSDLVANINTSGVVTGVGRGTVPVVARAANGIEGTATLAVSVLFAAIAAGDSHSCGVAAISPLRPAAPVCWGIGSQGRLGIGSDESSNTAQDVTLPLALSRISTGAAHTCALTTGGQIWCWGYNGLGQLGDATMTNSNVPVQTVNAATFTQVSTGQTHTCAVSNANIAYCWGSASFGQLGTGAITAVCGTAPCQQAPAAVSGGLLIRWVAAGSRHTCGIVTPSGVVYCWGHNGNGQLGNGGTTGSSVPVPVSSGVAFTELAAGDDFTCGLATDGRAFCWGKNNAGQLGTGSLSDATTPQVVSTGVSFVQIAAGGQHACGRTAGGQIWCWGSNAGGQLGQGNNTDVPVPVLVQAPELTFTALAAGKESTCGIVTGGIAYCWGRNTGGQLGDATNISKSLPVRVQ